MDLNFLKEQIRIFAFKNVNIECCGLVLKDGGGIFAVPCENISKTPNNHFIIDPERFKSVSNGCGYEIIGFYHSHPVGLGGVSAADKAMAEKSKLICYLYRLEDDVLEEYKPQGYEIPYESRPFLLGLLDCYTLVKDWYQRELNINLKELNHFLRETSEWEPFFDVINNNELLEHYLGMDFIEVSKPKRHDIILTRTFKMQVPVHSIIYLGNDELLHHPGYSYSLRDHYSGLLKKATKHIVRHKLML